MTLNFEFVRGNERLECDFFVWSDTIELATAFGWKPRSFNPLRLSLSKLSDFSNPQEFADEDALSLAAAIRQCLWMLAENKRLTRRQMARLIVRYRLAQQLVSNEIQLFSLSKSRPVLVFFSENRSA